jgi:hypothetical protein
VAVPYQAEAYQAAVPYQAEAYQAWECVVVEVVPSQVEAYLVVVEFLAVKIHQIVSSALLSLLDFQSILYFSH